MNHPIPANVDTPCRRHDPDMWFPEPGATRMAEHAKTLCKTACPKNARDACLLYGLHNRTVGIWGGFDAKERKKLRDTQGITPAPVGITTTWATVDDVLRMHDRGNPAEHIARVTGASAEWIRQVVRDRKAS